jgi:three-Cys-motif partner protein
VTEHAAATRYFFADDDLPVTAAEPWVRNKINIVRQYLASFVTNQISRVDDIVFVDLFAGNGLYSIGSRKELFPSAALMALSLDLPISKFVLCEPDAERARILKIRVNKYFRNKNVILLEGKPEEILDRLSLYVPESKGEYRTSVFCLCDPFSLDVSFESISRLANKEYSFLLPFTFALNDQLNYIFYVQENRERLKKFLGGLANLERLEQGLENNTQFYKRLIRIYENNILSLGHNVSTSVHKLDSGLMEMPMYYMGLFSKQVSTKSVLQDVEAARHIQFDLFES